MDDDQTPINSAPERRRRLPAVVEDVALTLRGQALLAARRRLQGRLRGSPLALRAGRLDAAAGADLAASGSHRRAQRPRSRARRRRQRRRRRDRRGGRPRPGDLGRFWEPAGDGPGRRRRQAGRQGLHHARPRSRRRRPCTARRPVFKAPATKSSSGVNPAKPIEAALRSVLRAPPPPPLRPRPARSPPIRPPRPRLPAPTRRGPRPSPVPRPAPRRSPSPANSPTPSSSTRSAARSPRSRKAFAATATPELSKALLQRPPRQPANVKVPKAKVVNVVAGPSQGGVYSLSVSLLRVGVTSELRLEMEQVNGKGGKSPTCSADGGPSSQDPRGRRDRRRHGGAGDPGRRRSRRGDRRRPSSPAPRWKNRRPRR